ncbi:amidohydrolase family protein [Leucobacter allii]|uniref:Amidohydrolase family protein n=1 Tax=Leucobacter allii TaxID=2932247 RepID=A0ABY4FIR8_9MICO|nr:amidohydrolase family protein [Leucobacter allii]UOQ56586.1 amidohydrolase family protein [Leucobacter allii]
MNASNGPDSADGTAGAAFPDGSTAHDGGTVSTDGTASAGGTVFTGGTVIVDPDRDGDAVTSDAIAFRDGRVRALGAEALALLDADPTAYARIDLAGGTLAPALGDGHAHPLLGGVEALGPRIREAADLPGILSAVAAWKAEHPDAEWIVGASYDATFAEGGLFDARWLDEVTGDTPTILRAWDYHTAWANSAALAAGGITADTPDPALGRIVRRADGSPLGTLQEAAANDFLADVVPAFALAQRLDAIERATRAYAAQGTTWIQDAWVEPGDLEVYLAAAEQGRLHTRVNLAFRADPARWRAQRAAFAAARERVRGLAHPRLTAETVKFFVDGVVESHTAALLEPYADRPDDRGLPNWSPDELAEAAAAFDADGFQLHLHAIGDAANRHALDALGAARAADPERERHHVIAHVALLDPADVARFAELGVIANFEPYWAQCDAVMRDLTIPHLGHPRDEWQYLIGSIHRSGATVSFGSDWPVTTLDWRPALATAITRHDPADPEAAAWLPGERIDAGAAYAAYTAGIARQALAPDRGTLEVGRVADAVWLSADPLRIAPEAIAGLEVRGTWLAGKATFRG